MKHVDILDALTTAAPVMIKMTRRDKLRHWAGLVRQVPSQLYIFHRLEHWVDSELARPVTEFQLYGVRNAFEIALKDKVLQAEGLRGNSIAAVQNFMELTKTELHEFSCDCGGAISNEVMADRIERIAG